MSQFPGNLTSFTPGVRATPNQQADDKGAVQRAPALAIPTPAPGLHGRDALPSQSTSHVQSHAPSDASVRATWAAGTTSVRRFKVHSRSTPRQADAKTRPHSTSPGELPDDHFRTPTVRPDSTLASRMGGVRANPYGEFSAPSTTQQPALRPRSLNSRESKYHASAYAAPVEAERSADQPFLPTTAARSHAEDPSSWQTDSERRLSKDSRAIDIRTGLPASAQPKPVPTSAAPLSERRQFAQARHAEAEVALRWTNFMERDDLWPEGACAGLRALVPKTESELRDLQKLVRVAGARSRLDPHDRNHRAPDCADRLLAVYQEYIDRAVAQGDVSRAVRTVLALLQDGTSPETLRWACRMALARDFLSQEVVSQVGYWASFGAFNTLALQLKEDEAHPALLSTLPLALHTVAPLVAQRWLRHAEMAPGWTRPIGQGPNGEILPAVETDEGRAVIERQYRVFLGSLGLATGEAYFGDNDRWSRTEIRRSWGALAAALVALDRHLGFRRDHPWLDASTPDKHRIMRGAIDELTSPVNTATALAKYVVVRPVVGALSMVWNAFAGSDLHGRLYRSWEHVAPAQPASGSSQRSDAKANGMPELPPVAPAGVFQGWRTTAARMSLFAAPMALYSQLRSAPDALDGLDAVGLHAVVDNVLVWTWGPAMYQQERITAGDPGIRQENQGRARQWAASLGRRGASRDLPVSGEGDDVERAAPVRTLNLAQASPAGGHAGDSGEGAFPPSERAEPSRLTVPGSIALDRIRETTRRKSEDAGSSSEAEE